MSYNKITLIGNLGKDPELRYTPQGIAVCNFSLAVNDKKRDNAGETQEVVTWFRITLWRNLAENASKYLTKGSPVFIEGRLKVDEWQDRDGKDRYTLDVTASEMQFLSGGGRQDDMNSPQDSNDFSNDSVSSNKSDADDSSPTPNDDDIPF